MNKFIFIIIISLSLNSFGAENSLLTLKQQLDRLQREVNDLSKSVFSSSKNSTNKTNNNSSDTSDLTAFDLRIYDLEKDIKKLNNNFEELIFQIDDLSNLYKNLNLDMSNILLENSTTEKNEKSSDLIEQNILGSLIINSEDLSKIDKLSNNLDKVSDKAENIEIQTNPEDEFQKAFDMIRGQQFDDAKKKFREFIKNYPENILSGSAHYWLGEIYLLKKEYREAALVLAEGFQKYPKSAKAPDMLYKLSESLILIDKKDDACSTLNKLINEFAKDKIVIKAKNNLIELNCPANAE